ncbi:MAG: hypothetical protein K2M06_03190, partial [Muribaculaceae bacterium]|nr:hypothetical protein [Muribaculaceae bacterium]
MKELTRQRLIYMASDYLMLNVGMLVFYVVRYKIDEHAMMVPAFSAWFKSTPVILGQILFPLGIMVLFLLSGCYNRSPLFYR